MDNEFHIAFGKQAVMRSQEQAITIASSCCGATRSKPAMIEPIEVKNAHNPNRQRCNRIPHFFSECTPEKSMSPLPILKIVCTFLDSFSTNISTVQKRSVDPYPGTWDWKIETNIDRLFYDGVGKLKADNTKKGDLGNWKLILTQLICAIG
jgi:hypothetical protein